MCDSVELTPDLYIFGGCREDENEPTHYWHALDFGESDLWTMYLPNASTYILSQVEAMLSILGKDSEDIQSMLKCRRTDHGERVDITKIVLVKFTPTAVPLEEFV